jgi:CheY-like chemotaxis protein
MKISHVLLVEDNPEDAQMTREALEAHDCRVDVIEDGESAIEFLTREGAVLPDVVLLDLYLPKKNGLEVLDAIRKERSLDSTPVLVLTSSSATEHFLKQLNDRLNGCVHKPVQWEECCRVLGVEMPAKREVSAPF